jgi:hypothetical protein
MKRLYILIGKHFPEICALTASVVVLSGGSYLSWNYDLVWLNRAGTLIEIIGVLLAASRFHEWIQQKVSDEFEQNKESIYRETIARVETEAGEVLSDEKRIKFRAAFKEQFFEQLGTAIEPHKRRIKLWEIYLVICGAFISGFGDYIVALLKSYGI